MGHGRARLRLAPQHGLDDRLDRVAVVERIGPMQHLRHRVADGP